MPNRAALAALIALGAVLAAAPADAAGSVELFC